MVVGEAVRLWAAGHIGRVSRTRGSAVGPLVETGPYAVVRNPLYIGNIFLFLGFGLIFWPAPVVMLPVLFVYYSAIVRWEEANLTVRIGTSYLDYQRRVPRWFPRSAPRGSGWSAAVGFRSERGTFIVLALAFVLTAVRCYTRL